MAQTITTTRQFVERSRGRLVTIAIIVIGLYFVVAFGEQAWKARQLEAELAERQVAIAAMESRRDELRSQLDAYSTERYDAYVERIAHRDLNLAYPGETALLPRWIDTPTPAPTPVEPSSSQPVERANWRAWVSLFTGD